MPLNVSREEVFTSYEHEVKKLRRLGKDWRLTDSQMDEIINSSFQFVQQQHIQKENVKSSNDKIATESIRPFYSFQLIIRIVVVVFLTLSVVCLCITYHKPTYNLAVRNVQELIYPVMKCLRRITLPIVKALPSVTGNLYAQNLQYGATNERVMCDIIALVLDWPNCISISSNDINRPGRLVDHPPPSSAEVKERVELHLYFPLDLHGLFSSELYLTFRIFSNKVHGAESFLRS